MSNSVVSKNLYELLGNDPELDPNRAPEPPTKVIDKSIPRAGKRNGTTEAPVKEAAPARAGRKEAFSGNEQAIRDKNAGSSNNRSKPTEDGARPDRRPRDSNRGRGGRGQGRGAPRSDRHDRSGVAGAHAGEKQAAHGWGGETGDAEFADEKAGLADARAEEKEGGVIADSTPVNAEGEKVPEVEEDNTKSYEQYLAEQLEKKAALNAAPLAPRKANEGSSKKFPEGKAFTRNQEEAFIEGTAGKASRQRERKTKDVVDVDLSWKEDQAAGASADRGAPRGGRGGRGRGGPRGGDRGDRGARRGGDRAERGERAPRGAPRADRSGPTPNVTSAQDFPSLS